MSSTDTNNTSSATRYLSQAAAAETLDVSPDTIRRMIRRGDLPAVRVGRLIRIPADALEQSFSPVPVIAGAR